MPAPARLPLQQKEALAKAYKTIGQAYRRATRILEAAGETNHSFELEKDARRAERLQRQYERSVDRHAHR